MVNTISNNNEGHNSVFSSSLMFKLQAMLILSACTVLGMPQAQAQLYNYQDFYSQPSFSVDKTEDLVYGVGSTNYYLFNGAGNKSNRSDYNLVTRQTLTLDLYQPNTGASNGKRAVVILVPGSGRNGCVTVNTCDVDTIREAKISTSTAHYISQEGDNYNELSDRGNRAINFAKRGMVVVSPVTRYQYQNRQQDNANSFRWKDDNGAALFNGVSTHMEPLIVDLKRVVRWLSKPGTANKYNIDPNNIYIMGSSGGSKMASLAAITATDKLLTDDPAQLNSSHPDHQFEVNNNNLNVTQLPLRGAIMFAGDTNGTRHLKLMNSETADFMFWHGTTDRAILHGMAETIEEKCEYIGCTTQFYSLPGVEHNKTALGKTVHTNANEAVGFAAHVHDFMVNQLQQSGADNRPTIGISSRVTQFNESAGTAKIEIELDKPATEDIRFTMSADQMREVTSVNGLQGRYDLIQQYVANDGNSTGPVMYDQSTGVAYELKANLPAAYKNLSNHTKGPGEGKPVVIPQSSDYFFDDFTGKKQRMTIARGQTKAVFNVDIVDDTLSEQNECFKVRLLNAQGARMTNTVETIVIRDDDNPNASSSPACANNVASSQNPQISVQQASVNEGAGEVSVEFTVNGSLEEDVTINYKTRNDTADSSDYSSAQGSVRMTQNSNRVSLPITIIDDTKVEGSERFFVDIVSVSGSSAVVGNRSAAVSLTDNDSASQPTSTPVISINQSVFISESKDVSNIRLTSDQTLTEDIVISYRTIDGSARSADGDYEGADGQIVIEAGRNRDSIPITILDDNAVESNESFSVKLLRVESGQATLGVARSTVTIIDDDVSIAVPTLSTDNIYVNEASGVASVVVRANRVLTEDVTFTFRTPGGTANAADGDYVNRDSRATIIAGRDRVTITIKVLDDARSEGNEFFSVLLTSIVNGTGIVSPEATRVTIIDNDN